MPSSAWDDRSVLKFLLVHWEDRECTEKVSKNTECMEHPTLRSLTCTVHVHVYTVWEYVYVHAVCVGGWRGRERKNKLTRTLLAKVQVLVNVRHSSWKCSYTV